MEVGGKLLSLEFFLGGDYKFILTYDGFEGCYLTLCMCMVQNTQKQQVGHMLQFRPLSISRSKEKSSRNV